jgi:hypothetical protein
MCCNPLFRSRFPFVFVPNYSQEEVTMNTVRVRKPWLGLLFVLPALLLGLLALSAYGRGTVQAQPQQPPVVQGPTIGAPVTPYVMNTDLRDLPVTDGAEGPLSPVPLRYTPGTEPKGSAPQLAGWRDPVAQTSFGAGQMPDPIANFAGLGPNGYVPPDTNGDVGPNHYIQTVNVRLAVFNKSTGAIMAGPFTFNDFFTGTGTICDTNNAGDPVVVYDRLADRWVITDFAFVGGGTTPPYYECVAVSQTGDPVGGGWYFYAFLISNTALNDYPKIGVWPDAYYVTFNMFLAPSFDWDGVTVWALERAEMLNGSAAATVEFALGPDTGYGSLMPANMQSTPPAGAPNYVASVEPLDKFQLWEFDVDWVTPANSTFTGPTVLNIADFAIAQSVPQLGTGALLDSLSFRPMMQLQYREVNGVESLWLNHTVAATEGIGGVRWYEVQDPGGTPLLAQEGTYQPDEFHRWMGSLAVDQDGNMAVGYSVSSSTMRPAIRYAGRQYGEAPGLLPQSEATLIQGGGSQTGSTRWGDYSHMTVDPVDDCTFWYTTEYYVASSGTTWATRIGSFRFPSCGQPKGWIEGTVRNSVTLEPVEGALVVAESISQTLSVQTDSNGYYTMTLLPGSFDVVAAPLLPGYPVTSTIETASPAAGNTETADLFLDPVPYLVEDSVTLDDSAGNGNGYAEPGEADIILWEDLLNTGALTATNVTAELTALTTGVTVQTANADYPDVPAGEAMTNSTPFTFAVDSSVVCGTDLEFEKTVTSDEGTWTIEFSLNASEPLPPAEVFNNDVEGGAAGWTTGGAPAWAITTEDAHSPTHSWTDSPGGNYGNNVTSWVRTPAFSLTGKRNIELSGWYKWELETGYDYVYIDYSLNGGITWSGNNEALAVFNGFEDWTEVVVDASVLDGALNVALRWRLVSDGGVVEDGIHLDDLVLSYEPYQCTFTGPTIPDAPALVSPTDGATVSSPVELTWAASGTGGTPTGYVLDVDGTVYTFTTPITTTTMAFDPGSHTWRVKAFNTGGSSAYSPTWTFTIQEAEATYVIYIPFIRKD